MGGEKIQLVGFSDQLNFSGMGEAAITLAELL